MPARLNAISPNRWQDNRPAPQVGNLAVVAVALYAPTRPQRGLPTAVKGKARPSRRHRPWDRKLLTPHTASVSDSTFL
jgi:hypothetical protein